MELAKALMDVASKRADRNFRGAIEGRIFHGQIQYRKISLSDMDEPPGPWVVYEPQTNNGPVPEQNGTDCKSVEQEVQLLPGPPK